MLLESIQIYDNKLLRLPYHQARIARSLKAIYNSDKAIDFSPMEIAASSQGKGRYKLRIEYNEDFLQYKIIPYVLPVIKSLKLVPCSHLKYGFKYSDRSQLDNLYEQRGSTDDILIISSGMVTDTWYCNVALLRQGQWETPYLPLLHGTRRQALLDLGLVSEAMISVKFLEKYSKIRLFNAMIEFGEIELEIGSIQSD